MRAVRSDGRSRRTSRPSNPERRAAKKAARARRESGRRYLAVFSTLLLGAAFFRFTRPPAEGGPVAPLANGTAHFLHLHEHEHDHEHQHRNQQEHISAVHGEDDPRTRAAVAREAEARAARDAKVHGKQTNGGHGTHVKAKHVSNTADHLGTHDRSSARQKTAAPTRSVHWHKVPSVATHTTHHGPFPARLHRAFTVRCFRSRSTGFALCAHRPLCAAAGGLVSLSANSQATAVERYAEESAEMPVHARLDATYLRRRRVHWWEGSVVLVHGGPKCASVVQFLRRVTAAYHAARHLATRYGSARVHAVVIVASPGVMRRLRFSRSWHRALLDALSYPGRADLRQRAALRFARRVRPPSRPRVFVLPDWRHLAPNADPHTPAHLRPVACFRSAAFAAPGSSLLLEPRHYPRGFPGDDTPNSDLDAFRNALFQAVLSRPAPPARRRVVYVHRARVRALAVQGAARIERTVAAAARASGFDYIRLDADGMSVSSMLAAMGNAGVVVGVHGTTLLPTAFLASGAALVEILPYRYRNELYARAPGAAVSYSAHTLTTGDDYPGIVDFGSVAECQAVSGRCRTWYRSDSRPLRVSNADEQRIGELVRRALRQYK